MTMEPVLHSFAYCLDFLREQVAHVEEADMFAQPNGIMNHPAWVIGHLTHACQLLGGVVAQLAESRLDEPFPDESYRAVFPTIRHALTQVLVGHTANHIGQLSVWRWAMGLAPMARPFE